MAIEVELPDGSIAEFPDGTPPEVMKAAIQKRFKPQAGKSAAEMTPEELNANNARLTGTPVNLDPAANSGFGQNLAAGFGKAFVDTGEGLKQLVGMGMTPEQVAERRQLDAPLMSTGGGILGNVLGQVTQIATPVGGGARLASYAGKATPYVAAAARGGAFAATQPVATGESRGGNTATGAALGTLGQGVATVASRAATSAKASLGPVVRESIEAARRMGIPLNVSQVTNSGPIRAAQSITKYLPFSGAAKSAQAQQEAFNRAVGKTFGADSAVLSDDVMKAARQKLSQQFDEIYSRNDVAITPDTVRRLAEVERRAFQDMVPEQAGVIRNQINKILAEAGDGTITGRKYQALRTALQKAEKGDANIGRVVKEVRSELDDAAAQSIRPQDAATLTKIRSGWANLRTTEDALGQVSGASGNLRPAALWPLIRKGSTKEMRELAKIGQNVLKEGMADSGSAQRIMYQGLLTGGAGAGGLMTGGLAGATSALTGLGQVAAGGALFGRALNSKAAANLLQQGKPTAGLARLAKAAPRLLPVIPAQAAAADVPMDIGTVSGYDRNDPRYRGD